MVRIRLALQGSKKKPFYYIVVTDSKSARNGYFIERVGFFNPMILNSNQNSYMNFEKIQFWLSKGAQPSARVFSLMKKQKFFKNTI